MSGARDETGRVASPTLVAVCLGYFLVILDSTVVNVALPAIRDELDAGVSGRRWVVDGYLVVLAAGLLSGGALADRFGARRVFQVGVAVFVAASMACGLAPDTAVLIATRAVQGVGAALAVPASLALLRAAYDDPRARARAVGVWGGIAGVAAAAGFGMSFTMPAATTAVTESAPPEQAGLAAGVINAARQTGSVVGIALLGAWVGGGTPFVTGLRIALVIAGCAFLVGALLAVDRRPRVTA
ncbi:MFS transporter [Streptomyces sp. B6B3]|uniref:MFS transporter n=1 Tax=Streptomyces sp. B6B3 TaxID=3153570 RepID=UPI00325DD52F